MKFFRQRYVAVICMVIMIIGASFLGSYRTLHGEQVRVEQIFYKGTYEDEGIRQILDVQVQKAKNIMKLADKQHKDVKIMHTIIEDLQKETGVSNMFLFHQKLGTSITAMYNEMKKENLSEQDRSYLEADYTDFVSNERVLSHHAYNEMAQEFNEKLERFPASIFTKVLGIKKVEYFK